MTAHPIDETEAAAQRSGRHHKSRAAFRTISEVADELDVAQHVLRFWESKFPQVRPLKRGGGRRYYRPEDVELLREIRTLLYGEGYTIKGAEKLLRQRRNRTQPDRPTAAARQAKPDKLETDNDSPVGEGKEATTQIEAGPSIGFASPAPAPERAGLVRIRERLVSLKSQLDSL